MVGRVLSYFLVFNIFSSRLYTFMSSVAILGMDCRWSHMFQLVVTSFPNYSYCSCTSLRSFLASVSCSYLSSSSSPFLMLRFNWSLDTCTCRCSTSSPIWNTWFYGTMVTPSTGALGNLSYVITISQTSVDYCSCHYLIKVFSVSSSVFAKVRAKC